METDRARLRAEVILLVRNGTISASEGAKRLGVSRKTYYEWEHKGLSALMDALTDGVAGRPATAQEDPELPALRKAQSALDAWYLDWAAAQSERDLATPVAFTLTTGNKGTMTRGEILLHVVNHSTYHRGWVCDLFFQVPARPPETDLPVFVRAMAQG